MHGGKASIAAERMLILQLRAANVNRISRISACFRETWTTYAVELTAGEHTITWTYQKDSSVDKEGDYANVDNVYVGAPVVPTSIEVENVTVPAGRRATVPTPFSPQKRSTRTLPSAPQTPRSQPLTKTALLSALRKAPPPLP